MIHGTQTERLTLIELTANHTEAFHTLWSDPEATKWSTHGTTTTIEASRKWMETMLRSLEHDTRRCWMVYVTGALESSQCAGMVTLRPSHELAEERLGMEDIDRWEIGYLFRPRYWGKGYALEACRAVIDSLREELESLSADRRARIVAYVDPGNNESLKLLKKLGFEVMRHQTFDAPDRFLAGQWRKAENLVLKRDLIEWRAEEPSLYAAVHQLGLPSASPRAAPNP